MSKFSFSSKPVEKPAFSLNSQPTAQQAPAPKPAPVSVDFAAIKKKEQEEAKRIAEEKKQEELQKKRQEILKQEESKKQKADGEKEKEQTPTPIVQAEEQKVIKLATKRPVETKEQRDARIERYLKEEEAQRNSFQGEKDKQKPLTAIFSGHVDHGKSSMLGHLLANMGQIDERQIQKLKQEAAKLVGESWGYAFALDACQEEREKGKTVESARATVTTASGRRIVLLDSPGHKGFIGSMIESAAQSDVGVLVTSARKGEFEAGLEKSGQTSEHGLILYISGVKNLIIAVNKMDDPTCQYSQERFEQIKKGLTTYLTKTVGYSEKNLTFVPVSALTGENLTTKVTQESPLSKWYNGPCLVDLLDEVKIPKRDVGGFPRACVSGKYRDQGYFAVCKVEKGQFKKNEKYLLMPAYEEVQILNIEDEVGNQIEVANAGENCRLQIDEKQYENIQDGCVFCDRQHMCEVSKSFVVKFLCVNCPSVLTKGFTAMIHVNTTTSSCKIKQVLGVLDPKTGKIDKEAPKFVKPGQSALIEFECDKEICINKFDIEGFLGRVLVRHEMSTIGMGQVVKICYE